MGAEPPQWPAAPAGETERTLRAFFDAAGEAMAFTVGGHFERVNAAFCRLFGFERPEEAAGLWVGDLIVPEERPHLQERHRQRLAGTPPPSSYTTRCVRRDGREIDVEVRTSELREGERVTTISVLRDITSQRENEARLRESERRFRELFEFVPVSLWEVDASAVRASLDRLRAAGVTEFRSYSEAHPELLAESMTAYRVVSVNGFGRAMAGARTQEELLANLGRIHVRDSFARYRELGLQLAEGRSVAHAEGWLGTIEGELRWMDTTATIVPGHEADWGRILFASVDMTDRRRAEQERIALLERLRQSEKLEAVGRLAGGIAHDFNNILSGILGYAELSLLVAESGSVLHEHQERIREAALRARALVRQILAFSQRDRGGQRVVDVPTVVKEALGLMRAGIPSTVTLETRIDPEAGATRADPTQLHQIVLNLCSNARDAIGPYGRIEVEVAAVTADGASGAVAPGAWIRIRVRDDGTGMDPETQARIFEPYMTTKGPFGGHGLGLPVVHGIVSAAGGAIDVRSVLGRGSTFDVYLPRAEPVPAEPPPPGGSPAAHGERILLVDDEPLVRGAHRRLLESLGYSVEVADDGAAALERIREAPGAFDLLLTDQSMPKLAGADLARAVRAIRPDLPVLLVTGFTDPIDDARARELGVHAVLQKPIEHAALATAVRSALDGG